MVVGRACSMKLTGYNWSTALAERIEAGRVAEELAAERYGDLWVELKAVAKATAECRSSQGTAGSAGEGMHGLLKAGSPEVDQIESEAVEIDRRYADPDDEAARAAALSAAVQYVLGETALPDAGMVLLRARQQAAVALAATQQIARMAALDGLTEAEAARQAGLDRMTIRKLLGKR